METNEDIPDIWGPPSEKCLNSKCLQKEQYFEWYRQDLHKQIDKIKLENEKEKEIDKKKWENVFRITVGKDIEMKKLRLENEELKRKNNQLENALSENSGSVEHGKSGGSQESGQNDSQTIENHGNDVELKDDDISHEHPGGN